MCNRSEGREHEREAHSEVTSHAPISPLTPRQVGRSVCVCVCVCVWQAHGGRLCQEKSMNDLDPGSYRPGQSPTMSSVYVRQTSLGYYEGCVMKPTSSCVSELLKNDTHCLGVQRG